MKRSLMLRNNHLKMTLLIVAILLVTLSAWAIEGKPAVSAAPAPAQQSASPSVNGITQAAVKSGVLACASRINQVANFLTAGSQGIGALLFVSPLDPERQLVSVSMEIPVANASTAYASASFAPNQANGCGMYESVSYWSQSCDEVSVSKFSEFKKTGVLAKTLAVLDGGQASKVFLMPAGSGCVSIKKEIVQ